MCWRCRCTPRRRAPRWSRCSTARARSVRGRERAVAVPQNLDADAHEEECREAHQHLEARLTEQPPDVVGEAVGEVDADTNGHDTEQRAGGMLGELWQRRNTRTL